MGAGMSRESRDEYLAKMKARYQRAQTRRARSALLNEFCEVTGHERKYANKLLSGRRGCSCAGAGKTRGRPKSYGAKELEVLRSIWRHAEMPCGKRLVAMLPDWLAPYESRYGAMESGSRGRLLAMSAATADRLLQADKVGGGSQRKLGVKNAAVRAAVPIRSECWDAQSPGWIEADTVALGGSSMSDNFVWALTATDVHTGWTEARGIWNRGAKATREALQDIEENLPFTMLGIDTDNGSEFLNWHVISHYADRDVRVEQTRSRPYQKNDQARIEQKNWTHVRQLLGYERYSHKELVAPINGLLEYWGLWKNLYHPTMRQVERSREGGKLTRRHEKRAQTPLSRLKENPSGILGDRLQTLETAKKLMDPFIAKETIEDWLDWINRLRNHLNEAQSQGEDTEQAAAAFGPCPWLRSAPPGTGSETNETNEKERRTPDASVSSIMSHPNPSESAA